MKRHAALVAATLVGVVFGVGSPAGQAARDTAAKPAPVTTAGLSAKPFERLFMQQVRQAESALKLKTMQLELTKPNSARRFICGNPIVVITPDASVDPRFELPLPDTKTQFSMRTASPAPCR